MFVARSVVKVDGRQFLPGEVIPRAEQIPTIATEMRLGRIDPMRAGRDGHPVPVRYRVIHAFGDHQRGDVIDDVRGMRAFRILVRARKIEPILEDAVDQPQHRVAMPQQIPSMRKRGGKQ